MDEEHEVVVVVEEFCDDCVDGAHVSVPLLCVGVTRCVNVCCIFECVVFACLFTCRVYFSKGWIPMVFLCLLMVFLFLCVLGLVCMVV